MIDGKIFASKAKSGELVEFPDIERGWGITENLGFIPPMEYFNGAFNRIDLSINEINNNKLDATAKATDSSKLNGKDASEYVLKSELSDGLPIGAYLQWSSEAKTPDGFLLCDGRSLNKTEYSELFDVIGYTYGGSGDNFNIPVFNDGRFMRSIGGNALPLGQKQSDAIRNIVGYVDFLHSMGFESSDGALKSTRMDTDFIPAKSGESMARGGSVEFDASMVVPTANENRPINSSVVILIKAKDVKEPNATQIDSSIYATETKAGITKLKNIISGVAQDSAVTEKAIKEYIDRCFANLNAENGYQKFPSGLILQWGVSAADEGYRNLAFPIAFPNKMVFATASGQAQSAGPSPFIRIGNRTNATCEFLIADNSGSRVNFVFFWFAIGY